MRVVKQEADAEKGYEIQMLISQAGIDCLRISCYDAMIFKNK